jgi:N-acyl-L-homoserine lactone synthetase
MIRLIQGAEIEAMHRLRAAVFHERLAWPVTVLDGWERDGFDELNPLYVLVTTRDGTVRGSARLLPTTGPNMLADVFCDLLPEGKGALADHLGELTVLGAARPPRAAGLPDQPNRRRAARRHRRGRHARIGRGLAVAGLFEMTDELLSSVRERQRLTVLRRRGFACNSPSA